ncbi:hypothetical protein WDJ51_05020 [Rathayibacter sp. YIM 133350]|uniref:DUF7882 family protein n=1 Tax=Rathayibacter sp. YIM 133350 TaxID=3131992 RepID=UPI00307D9422
MGTLFYDHEGFEFEDRVLAHLQLVLTTKLRRHEPFVLSWLQPFELGSGRRALWIDNGVGIHYAYSGSRTPTINREWVEQLMTASGRPGGVFLEEEPKPVSS